MRRVILAFAALAVLVAQATQVQAGAACCLCLQCASGPVECTLPAISCDIACAQAGCGDATLAPQEACNANPPCERAQPNAATAPAAGQLGLAAVAAALIGLGARRLMRRRGPA